MKHNNAWNAIFQKYDILKHDFAKSPYIINVKQMKEATYHFTKTSERENRIYCKQDDRESRPEVFIDNGLFLLPVKNGEFAIFKGEGYIDIPEIQSVVKVYNSKLDFKLESSLIGNSEMQHLDFAYATSLIRTFLEDDSLVLTIRGRKYTPKLTFKVTNQEITVQSVQTEIDAGYEGKNQIVLIEAKNSSTKNTVIRQLFYPYLQWQQHTEKPVKTLFFEKRNNFYSLWQFEFQNPNDYNSISLVKSQRYEII